MPCPSSVPRRWSAGIGPSSGPFGGRSRDPKTAAEIRKLIREMSLATRFWGAPRIHGELLKLGINVSQTTVAKYMARHRRPPSQGWRTFLINHAAGIASIDLFVVPIRHSSFCSASLCSVTAGGGSSEWLDRSWKRWDRAPRYLIRDRFSEYGEVFQRTLRIRDHPSAAFAMAEPLRRKAHRLAPTGVARPRCRIRRKTPSVFAVLLHRILQSGPDAPLLRQGLTDCETCRDSRTHRRARGLTIATRESEFSVGPGCASALEKARTRRFSRWKRRQILLSADGLAEGMSARDPRNHFHIKRVKPSVRVCPQVGPRLVAGKGPCERSRSSFIRSPRRRWRAAQVPRRRPALRRS